MTIMDSALPMADTAFWEKGVWSRGPFSAHGWMPECPAAGRIFKPVLGSSSLPVKPPQIWPQSPSLALDNAM